MDDYRNQMLEGPITEPTQKVRRNLLLVCVTSFLLLKGQLVPTRIDTLGLSIETLQREKILQVLLTLLVYYCVKFYIYMFVDGEIQVSKANKILVGNGASTFWNEFHNQVKVKQTEAFKRLGMRGLTLVMLKLFIDVVLPLIASIYAFYLLIMEV